MKADLYFSIPMQYDWDMVEDCIGEYRDQFHIDYWKRNTPYNIKALTRSDAMIVFLPDNKWKIDLDKLTAGVKKEIYIASDLDKPLYITYKPANSDCPLIYKATIMNGIISGVISTANKIIDDFTLTEEVNTIKKCVGVNPDRRELTIETIERKSFDNRILLAYGG